MFVCVCVSVCDGGDGGSDDAEGEEEEGVCVGVCGR